MDKNPFSIHQLDFLLNKVSRKIEAGILNRSGMSFQMSKHALLLALEPLFHFFAGIFNALPAGIHIGEQRTESCGWNHCSCLRRGFGWSRFGVNIYDIACRFHNGCLVLYSGIPRWFTLRFVSVVESPLKPFCWLRDWAQHDSSIRFYNFRRMDSLTDQGRRRNL